MKNCLILALSATLLFLIPTNLHAQSASCSSISINSDSILLASGCTPPNDVYIVRISTPGSPTFTEYRPVASSGTFQLDLSTLPVGTYQIIIGHHLDLALDGTLNATLYTSTFTVGTPKQDITCDSNGAINTAIGCITADDITAFLRDASIWALAIGGGIFFLLTLYASFQITTSTGNPRKLKSGQELLISAIAGLIMLVLSAFILKIIGVDILGFF